jgi:hypothetical protein
MILPVGLYRGHIVIGFLSRFFFMKFDKGGQYVVVLGTYPLLAVYTFIYQT